MGGLINKRERRYWVEWRIMCLMLQQLKLFVTIKKNDNQNWETYGKSALFRSFLANETHI
ncbi:hypothetical protein CDL12_01675 [Handroanthus impetiginosus]|uniref:Uncharacterized protein n=1 Tax=Handroanthus impetiginosus TaxID=429701 RepID=A0A2G9I729_9LAMI|nr:hypothetical protein CDL12_01675 [Handroanthus impetiginosus]